MYYNLCALVTVDSVDWYTDALSDGDWELRKINKRSNQDYKHCKMINTEIPVAM